jgi:hypothetical protein
MPTDTLFAVGLLIGEGGDGCAATGMNRISADARRLFDPGLSSPFGLQMRNEGACTAQYDPTGRGAQPTGGPVTKREMWERVFIRLRKFPTSGSPDPIVWALKGNVESGPALCLRVNGSGTLSLYNQGNATAPGALLDSVGLSLDIWYCVEIHARFNNAVEVPPNPPYENNALVSWRINGATISTHDRAGLNPQYGIDRRNQEALQSKVGDSTNVGKGLEIDYSDWIADGADWVDQSRRVTVLRATGAGTQTAWTGGNPDYRHQLDFPFIGSAINLGVSTQSASVSQTYAVESAESKGVSGAIYSARIAIYFSAVGGANVQLIVRRNGSESLYNIGTPPAGAWSSWRVNAAGWSPGDSLEVGVQNSPTPGGTTAIEACGLVLEHDTVGTGEGNGAVRVIQTTYTGNATQQSINLATIDPDVASLTPCLVMVFPESGTSAGAWWWDSKVYPSQCNNAGALSYALIARPGTVHITGSSGATNQNAITYRLIACFDPQQRIVSRGAVALANGSDDQDVQLRTASFVPEAVFIARESAPSNDATKIYYRGVGHTGDQSISLGVDTAAVSNAVQAFQTGGFEVGTLVNEAFQDFAFMAWRTSDFVSKRLAAVTSYVGNGSHPRTIALALDGALPIFALCVPTTNGKRWSRYGSVARQWNGGTTGAANSITAFGSDSITVGSELNASGVTYSVFALAAGLDHEVELRQLNRPTSTGTTDLGPTADTVIPAAGTAYITGIPEMPQLRARIPAPGSATSIDWSIAIVSERTERGNRDDISTSVVNLPADQAWAVDQTIAVFVGGSCTISYHLKNAGGYLGPTKTFPFKIRGKNPLDANAKQYVESVQGSYRFLWAIVQHESRQGTRIYNQFNASGSLAELPNYGPPDGWGISQIEGANTAQTYDWHANVQRALAIYGDKVAAQLRFFDAVARTYPTDTEAQNPPTSYTPPGTSTSMTAMEAGAVTLYNGAGGCPVSALLDENGNMVNFQNPWQFQPSNPTGQKWTFTPNSNNYLYLVIYNEYEGHLTSQE